MSKEMGLYQWMKEMLSHSTYNGWWKGKHINAYWKRVYMHLPGEPHGVFTLQLGNVSVDEGFQGKGIFSTMMKEAEGFLHRFNMTVITVGQVHNPDLRRMLEKNGYLPTFPVEDHSYFKRVLQ
jgi:GNAT superfamily N-acetyltransferase